MERGLRGWEAHKLPVENQSPQLSQAAYDNIALKMGSELPSWTFVDMKIYTMFSHGLCYVLSYPSLLLRLSGTEAFGTGTCGMTTSAAHKSCRQFFVQVPRCARY